MTGFVADASIIASWLLPDEEPDEGLVRLAMRDGFEVPFIWPAEIANVLLNAERCRRLAPGERLMAVSAIETMDVRLDTLGAASVWLLAYDLAMRNRLSLYDALYLELALRRNLPLATADARLATAAEAEGVVVLPAP